MTTNSLAFRLFATAAAWTLLVLPIAGVIIYSLYRDDVQTSFDGAWRAAHRVPVDSMDHGDASPGAPKDLYEPLFEVTHSGWYWQIKPLDATKPGRCSSPARSPASTIPLPSEQDVEPNEREVRWAQPRRPAGQTLRVAETIYVFGDGKKAQRYSVVVAGTLGEAGGQPRAFPHPLDGRAGARGSRPRGSHPVPGSLRPAARFARSSRDWPRSARAGAAARRRVAGRDRATADELNALIKSNQDVVDRARTQVGNLAHALKTPLAVIVNEARDEDNMLGRKVAEQAEVMRDQVNLYLDRARMAARAGVIGRVTPVLPVAEPLVRVLERLNKDRGITIEVACPDAAVSRAKSRIWRKCSVTSRQRLQVGQPISLSHGLHGAFARTAATEATLRPDRR